MTHDKNELIDLMMVFPKRVNAVSRIIAAKYLKDSRLKSYHLILINGIGSSDGISQKDLGDLIPFDKSYISIGVRDLMDMGYIVNEGQGKAHSLKLTDQGRDVMLMSDMMFEIIRQSIMANITPEENDELVRILRKMSDNMDGVIAQSNDKEAWAIRKWTIKDCQPQE